MLDFRLLVGSKRQQRKARWTAVHSIEVHSVFHAWNTEFANDAPRCLGDTLLLFTGEIIVAFFPGCVDFVTRRRGAIGKGKDSSDSAGRERGLEFLCSPYQYLESDFFLARLQSADNFDRARRRLLSG